jgi:hypothetical protein
VCRAALFGTPDVAVEEKVPGVFRAAWTGIVLLVADGWIASGGHYFAQA